MNRRIIYLIVFCLIVDTFYVQAHHCPNTPENGEKWDQDSKKGIRCILRCKSGYTPSGCHVLRKESGKWNYAIPKCEEDGYKASTILMYTGIGVGAAFAAPFVLTAAGFTAGGVAAGSIAASLQTSATAAGSWFALAQSAGAAGMAATTQAGIGAATAGTSKVAKNVYDNLTCESE